MHIHVYILKNNNILVCIAMYVMQGTDNWALTQRHI